MLPLAAGLDRLVELGVRRRVARPGVSGESHLGGHVAATGLDHARESHHLRGRVAGRERIRELCGGDRDPTRLRPSDHPPLVEGLHENIGRGAADRDADLRQIVEPPDEPGKIADTVVVGIEKGFDVKLIDDRVAVPVRIGGRGDRSALCHAFRSRARGARARWRREHRA